VPSAFSHLQFYCAPTHAFSAGGSDGLRQCCIPYYNNGHDDFDYTKPLSTQVNPSITLLCCAEIERSSLVFFLIPIVWFSLMLISMIFGPPAAKRFSCLKISSKRLRQMSIVCIVIGIVGYWSNFVFLTLPTVLADTKSVSLALQSVITFHEFWIGYTFRSSDFPSGRGLQWTYFIAWFLGLSVWLCTAIMFMFVALVVVLQIRKLRKRMLQQPEQGPGVFIAGLPSIVKEIKFVERLWSKCCPRPSHHCRCCAPCHAAAQVPVPLHRRRHCAAHRPARLPPGLPRTRPHLFR
jgi:hypothetical protein